MHALNHADDAERDALAAALARLYRAAPAE
jgi:hypothetical protein